MPKKGPPNKAKPTKPDEGPCHVFTQEWIAKQIRSQGKRPVYDQSQFYRIVTADDRRSVRETIERWVDNLPPAKRKGVIARLRKESNFDQTYNELAVGNSLRERGHEVEYEPELSGLTPDWLVQGNQGRFIVEVLTSNPDADREKCNAGWQRFAQRLELIPGRAVLSIRPPHPRPAPTTGRDRLVYAPTHQRQKEIEAQVRLWLEERPTRGEQMEVDGIQILFSWELPQATHVNVGLSLVPFWVDPRPLTKAMKEKASKYKQVVESEKLPFVVSVVIAFLSGRDLGHLERAVTGLFRTYPNLSAVTLAQVNGNDVTHLVLPNQAASFPLASWAFPQQ
jgi:hypothetical protein